MKCDRQRQFAKVRLFRLLDGHRSIKSIPDTQMSGDSPLNAFLKLMEHKKKSIPTPALPDLIDEEYPHQLGITQRIESSPP